jgi:drug/metabolite transporter (DMT)-like permease
MTLILSSLVLREKIGAIQVAGFAMSLAGVLLVISGGSWDALVHIRFQQGDILLLGCVICWAFYSVIGKRVMRELSPLASTTWSTLLGTAGLSVVVALQKGFDQLAEVSFPVWADWSYMAVFATVLGFLWFNQGVQRIGAAKAAVFINLVPIFTMMISLVRGEAIGWNHLLGAVLVIGGVLLGTQAKASLPYRSAAAVSRTGKNGL